MRGEILAFAGAVCWGFSATCASYLMGSFGLDIIWLTCVRLMIAGPLFFVAVLVWHKNEFIALCHDKANLVRVVLYAVFGAIFIQISYMAAIKYAGAGNALLLQEVGLVIIVFYTCIRAKRAPHARDIVCLILAILGVAAIATQGNIGQLGISPLGLFWGMVAGVMLAVYNLVPVETLKKYSSVVFLGTSMTLAALVMIPFARPWENLSNMPWEGWVALAAVILIGTVLAYVLYLKGVRAAGPVKASLICVFEPVSAMILSLVWLGDVISVFDLIGAALIVSMMILVSLPKKQDVDTEVVS